MALLILSLARSPMMTLDEPTADSVDERTLRSGASTGHYRQLLSVIFYKSELDVTTSTTTVYCS